jgi:hypothetical protein
MLFLNKMSKMTLLFSTIPAMSRYADIDPLPELSSEELVGDGAQPYKALVAPWANTCA